MAEPGCDKPESCEFSSLAGREYLQQNPGIPVMMEYNWDTNDQMDSVRNNSDPLIRRAVELYDATDTNDFIQRSRASGGNVNLDGMILWRALAWMPGMFSYADRNA